jgi:predicted CXXCH cytochrome family protein
VPALCVTCHDADSDAFRREHLGYPVGEARCTSCHDPHGSGVGGILHDNVHEPIRNKMCRQCHADAGAADPLELRGEGLSLCRGCHADLINEALLADRVHWPVVDDRACLNCHAAHASSEPKLLVEPTKQLCEECHRDVLQVGGKPASVTHAPVEQGSCASCHEPHASQNAFLLVERQGSELCGACHEWRNHTAHPLGPEVVDQRNPNLRLDCYSCHRPHASENEALAHFEPKRDLCVQCHQRFRR